MVAKRLSKASSGRECLETCKTVGEVGPKWENVGGTQLWFYPGGHNIWEKTPVAYICAELRPPCKTWSKVFQDVGAQVFERTTVVKISTYCKFKGGF